MPVSQSFTSFPYLFGETFYSGEEELENKGCFGKNPRNKTDGNVIKKHRNEYGSTDYDKSESDLVDTDVARLLHYLRCAVEKGNERGKASAEYNANDCEYDCKHDSRQSKVDRYECSDRYKRKYQ